MRASAATLALLFLTRAVAADSPQGCCGGDGPHCGMSTTVAASPGRPPGPGSSGMQRGMSGDEHNAIFILLSWHNTIARTVKEIPNGVQTRTTTTKPELVETLRTHVRQMVRRLKQQRPVRMWDPVFRDVFAHADEITVSLKDVEGGIEVMETSNDPLVVMMIRAHAAKVSSFVANGHAAARPPWAGRGQGRMAPGR